MTCAEYTGQADIGVCVLINFVGKAVNQYTGLDSIWSASDLVIVIGLKTNIFPGGHAPDHVTAEKRITGLCDTTI